MLLYYHLFNNKKKKWTNNFRNEGNISMGATFVLEFLDLVYEMQG